MIAKGQLIVVVTINQLNRAPPGFRFVAALDNNYASGHLHFLLFCNSSVGLRWLWRLASGEQRWGSSSCRRIFGAFERLVNSSWKPVIHDQQMDCWTPVVAANQTESDPSPPLQLRAPLTMNDSSCTQSPGRSASFSFIHQYSSIVLSLVRGSSRFGHCYPQSSFAFFTATFIY